MRCSGSISGVSMRCSGSCSGVSMRRRSGSQALWLVCALALILGQCGAFELQDTIHALIEENIHLHDQLENLTAALRELRQLLFYHANDHDHEHDEDLHHLWEEWSEHGISAETQQLLEHALCGHVLHGSAAPTDGHAPYLLLLSALLTLTHLLL